MLELRDAVDVAESSPRADSASPPSFCRASSCQCSAGWNWGAPSISTLADDLGEDSERSDLDGDLATGGALCGLVPGLVGPLFAS